MSSNATFSILGFDYQRIYPLYLLLERGRKNPNLSIKIEGFDDIDLIDGQTGETVLYQIKLSGQGKSTAVLSSKSGNFWKTLAIWTDIFYQTKKSNKLLLGNTDEIKVLQLVTTAKVNEKGTFIDLLQENLENRNNQPILDKIIKDAKEYQKSKAKTDNIKYAKEFLSITKEQQLSIIEKVQIIAEESGLLDIEIQILEYVNLFAYSKESNTNIIAKEELIKEWFNETRFMIRDNTTRDFEWLSNKIKKLCTITEEEHLYHILDREIAPELFANYTESNFVLCLKRIDSDERLINKAILRFINAYDFRIECLNTGIVTPKEEQKYEKELFNFWDDAYDAVKDRHNKNKEGVQNSAERGRSFYDDFNSKCREVIYKKNDEPREIFQGSIQMLANKNVISWNPEDPPKQIYIRGNDIREMGRTPNNNSTPL